MNAVGFRLRFAPRLSAMAGQVVIGVIATGLASLLFPASVKPPAEPSPKISMRVEPAPVRDVIVPMVLPAPLAAPAHAVASVVAHKPRPAVAVLPPVRPRDAEPPTEPIATPVAEAAPPDAGWMPRVTFPRVPRLEALAPARTALETTLAAMSVPTAWARDGGAMAVRAAAGTASLAGQFTPWRP